MYTSESSASRTFLTEMVWSYTAATWSSISGDIGWKLTGTFDICLKLAICQPLHAVFG